MRGYYGFSTADTIAVLQHLASLPQVAIEDREAVRQVLASAAAGLDWADALHHASYRDCEAMASFDDHKFARRARRLGLLPAVTVPA